MSKKEKCKHTNLHFVGRSDLIVCARCGDAPSKARQIMFKNGDGAKKQIDTMFKNTSGEPVTSRCERGCGRIVDGVRARCLDCTDEFGSME